MLAKANRLRQERDFKGVAQKGKAVFSPSLSLKLIRNNSDVSRFGIIVSTKVSKKAVLRNRLKRRLREIIRLNLPQLKKGFDIMVLTRAAAKDFEYLQLKEILEGLFRKANLYV